MVPRSERIITLLFNEKWFRTVDAYINGIRWTECPESSIWESKVYIGDGDFCQRQKNTQTWPIVMNRLPPLHEIRHSNPCPQRYPAL